MNPIQFAIMREDPAIELELARRFRPRRALVIASGGCTALALRAAQPELALTLLDPNPAQLELVRRKQAALARARGRVACSDPEIALAFGVGEERPDSLTACGNFEALFRQWRSFLDQFVLAPARRQGAFASDAALAGMTAGALASPYWPVSFELFFSDALLVAMFGPEAIQHAEAGSYPRYFQRAFERGLARSDALDNPWLHHPLLGHYLRRESALPLYLREPLPPLEFEMLCARVQDLDDWNRYDLCVLSNVCDWMPAAEVEALALKLARGMRPGAVLVLRQLNHRAVLDDLWRDAFDLDEALAAELLARDRSLFYSRLTVAVRRSKTP